MSFKLFLGEKAHLPTRGTDQAAGLDLYASQSMNIPANSRRAVDTQVYVALAPGTFARILPRSGLALNKGIDIGAGVVDSDYRGPIKVIIFNLSTEDWFVNVGDRIAQMVILPYLAPQMEVVDSVTGLHATKRGESGFGSTGVELNKT